MSHNGMAYIKFECSLLNFISSFSCSTLYVTDSPQVVMVGTASR